MGSYRIGLMVGNKPDDYTTSIRLGVQNTLEAAGHTMVNVADLVPYHTDANTETYLRVAFELAGRLDLDAVIVPMGCVNGYLAGKEGMAREFLEALDPAHTLVLERDIAGYRCLTKDNAPGMRACMRHLIETCGLTRIAFVSGPETSVGAQERERVYFEEMAAHGLEVPEGYFARGRFSGACREVIEQLIDEHPDVEAIACAADLIAYTTYGVMRRRRLAVGRDIAVTGFDDQPKSAHMDPPLSTVRMSAYDFGCMAAREALRMCAGLPQEEHVISSEFIARNSCGEGRDSELDRCRALVRARPFPLEEVADVMMEATLFMAGPAITQSFRESALAFLETVRRAYLNHRAHPGSDDVLFSSQDLASLFERDYRAHLSLEGFHAVAITLLEALMAESGEQDTDWIIDQISYLHLRVARMLNDAMQRDTRAMNLREWRSLHITEDSLADAAHPQVAYRLMLGELAELGVRRAHLFLLPQPVTTMGGMSLSLSDDVQLIGSLNGTQVRVSDTPRAVSLQGMLGHVLPLYAGAQVCVVGGIMAGNELMGVMTMDPGTLDDNGQLMVLLNAGLACKYLQMLATEREMNDVLMRNNLLLEHQSRRDELTGLLNRRGLYDGIAHELQGRPHDLAALLYLDLDGLKGINDGLGHDAGDDAIRETARVLEQSLPAGCLVARMGGDEFVAFARVEETADARVLADAVQRGVVVRNVRGDLPFELSLSCGWECFRGGDEPGEALTQAMVRADEHMYAQKRRRRTSRRYAG